MQRCTVEIKHIYYCDCLVSNQQSTLQTSKRVKLSTVFVVIKYMFPKLQTLDNNEDDCEYVEYVGVLTSCLSATYPDHQYQQHQRVHVDSNRAVTPRT